MNPISYWLTWFDRSRMVGLMGCLSLGLGVLYPWYRLPPQALSVFHTSLAWTNWGRLLAAVLIGLTLIGLLTMRHWKPARLGLWIGLVAVLLFPYFTTVWTPASSYVATSYFNQARQVNRHAEVNSSQVQTQWKRNITLSSARPVRSTTNFAIRSSRFFQLPSWDRFFVRGIGYHRRFFGFIGRGWVFTIIGLVLCLAGLYLGLEKQNFRVFVVDLKRLLPGMGVLASLMIVAQVTPQILNLQLDTAFAKGDYQTVLNLSPKLATYYPSFQADEKFLEREAKAGFYSNQPDPALVDYVKGLERYRLRDFQSAESYFQSAIAQQPNRFLFRGYLAASIINRGVAYFNGNKPETAAAYFEQALHIFPDHLEALYDLMVTRATNYEFDKSALAAQHIIKVQDYFQQPSISLLHQAYLHIAWATYHNGDNTQAWQEYRQALDTSTWGKKAGSGPQDDEPASDSPLQLGEDEFGEDEALPESSTPEESQPSIAGNEVRQ